MKKGNLVYPTDQVVGALPEGGDLDGLRAALRDAGVDDGQVAVHRDGDADLEPDPAGADGVIKTVAQAAQQVLGDEAERLRVLEDRLAEGATLVCIHLAADEDEEDARDEEKRRIGAVLRDHGARDVAFYGKYQIQQLDASAT